MTKNSPLHTLQELAHERVDDATRKLGELMASEQAANVKLELLQNYRREYRERFLASARHGIDPRAWQNYSNFLGKLDDAIHSQEQQLNRAQNATSQGQQNWVEQNTRAKAFDTLALRQQKQLAHRQGKLEQGQNDEHAARQFGGRELED